MQNHDTNSPNLSTTTDNSLNSSDEIRDYTYHFKESWIKELGWKGVILFSIIEGLTNSKGFVFASDKYLANKCEVSIPTIEKGLKALEDKGWIFRNSYPVNVGSKRHIIIFDKYLSYWRSYLSKPSIPQDVKLRYTKWGSKWGAQPFSYEPYSETRAVKNDGSSPAVKNDGSFLINKKETLSKSSEADQAPPLSSFVLLLKDELERSNITGSQKDTVLKYFEDNEDMIMGKDNSMAYIFKGINQGWLFDKAAKADEVKKETGEKKEIWSRNEAEAKRVFAKYTHLEKEYKLVIDKFMIQLSFNGSSTPLGFREPKFKDKLIAMERKCHDNISHSRKTNPMDEIGTEKEQVLR